MASRVGSKLAVDLEFASLDSGAPMRWIDNRTVLMVNAGYANRVYAALVKVSGTSLKLTGQAEIDHPIPNKPPNAAFVDTFTTDVCIVRPGVAVAVWLVVTRGGGGSGPSDYIHIINAVAIDVSGDTPIFGPVLEMERSFRFGLSEPRCAPMADGRVAVAFPFRPSSSGPVAYPGVDLLECNGLTLSISENYALDDTDTFNMAIARVDDEVVVFASTSRYDSTTNKVVYAGRHYVLSPTPDGPYPGLDVSADRLFDTDLGLFAMDSVTDGGWQAVKPRTGPSSVPSAIATSGTVGQVGAAAIFATPNPSGASGAPTLQVYRLRPDATPYPGYPRGVSDDPYVVTNPDQYSIEFGPSVVSVAARGGKALVLARDMRVFTPSGFVSILRTYFYLVDLSEPPAVGVATAARTGVIFNRSAEDA